ncbi:MAG: hypothetical protein AAF823_06860 [Planctomycetota bacterium]
MPNASDETSPSETNKPPASPRKPAKQAWLLAALAFGVSLLIALTVLLVVVGSGGPRELDEGEAIEATLGYDPSVNPFALNRPNALGVAAPSGTAVVVDASNSARAWLDDVATQLVDAGIQPTLITEDGPVELQPGETPQARGLGDAGEALAAVLRDSPRRVVWITSEPVAPQLAAYVEEAGIPVSVVAIGRSDLAAETLAEFTGGQYVRLSTEQIREWRDAAGQ